jgi:hypothetical protein
MRPALSFLLAHAAAASALCAQTPLFSNGSPAPDQPALSTGPLATSGAPAPASATWSELAHLSATEANAVAGFSSHLYSYTSSYRFADDFTVPAGRQWRLDTIDLFAYQPDAAAQPFASLNLEIWSGPPDSPASVRIFGDTLTNRLLSAELTNIYRIFNQTVAPAPPAPDTSRRLWRSTADAGQTWLPAGTYWITWQYVPLATDGVIFSPAVTIPGLRTKPEWNAKVLRLQGWAPALDAAKPDSAADLPQDFPFTLAGVDVCDGDYNRDGFANLDDLGDFITDFYITPAVPGGFQPAAPQYADRALGPNTGCPNAPDAPAPYDIDAYRESGYRVGFSLDGSNACPLDPAQNFPNLDNLVDFITAFYTPGC